MKCRKPKSARRRSQAERREEDRVARPLERPRRAPGKDDRLGSHYSAGPAAALRAKSSSLAPLDGQSVPAALALGSTHGTRNEVAVSGNGTSIRLRGRTDATFDGGSSRFENLRQERASGCEGCEDGCIRVRGTMILTYRVSTTVTLPSVNDYPDLTPCQQRRVQDAIDNVLAPHEEEHERAFETYNGTTRHPFDLTVCSSEEANERLQAIHDGEAATREAGAQALSDALDPFHFDVDLDCEDESSGSGGGGDKPGESATPPPVESPAPTPAEGKT